MTVGYNVTALD